MSEVEARLKAEAIWSDMTGRSGMDIDVDDDVREEILDEWTKIILEDTE